MPKYGVKVVMKGLVEVSRIKLLYVDTQVSCYS